MYFGYHEMIGKAPFPFTDQSAATFFGGICIIAMLLCILAARK